MVSADGKAAICPRVKSPQYLGEAGYLHKLDSDGAEDKSAYVKRSADRSSPPTTDFPIAKVERRNTVYATLLEDTLSLSDDHAANLKARGLPSDVVEANFYRTLPKNDRRQLAAKVGVNVKLAGVPGFYLDRGKPSLNGAAGLLIPIRNASLSIVACQIRRDKVDGGGKYVWLSSSGLNYGSGPGSPAHFAEPQDLEYPDIVVVTEGALKADIIAHFLKCPAIGVAGVASWRKAVDMLVQLLPREVALAFDNDRFENKVVQDNLTKLEDKLIAEHFKVYEAQWPLNYKGFDDYLATGAKDLAFLEVSRPIKEVSPNYKEPHTKSNKSEAPIWQSINKLKPQATHIVGPDSLPPFAVLGCECPYCQATREWQSDDIPKAKSGSAEFSNLATKYQDDINERRSNLATNHQKDAAIPVEYDEREDFREFNDALNKAKGEYLGLGAEETLCGRWAMVKSCENGHYILKRLVCGREWCPKCGQDHSEHHRRRISRLIPRVFAMGAISYLVFEVPLSLRDQFRDVEKVRQARRYVHRLLKREFNTRGVSRWHYYGEPRINEFSKELELGKYHPHLNVLLEHGFIGKKQLKRIRRLWSQWLYNECGQKRYYKIAPVYTKYSKSPGKKWHWVAYITRPTFKVLSDENIDLAKALYDFNNCSWFGKFSNADKDKGRKRFEKWAETLPESDKKSKVAAMAIDSFNSDICPVCHAPLKYCGIDRFDAYEVIREFGGGVYEARAPDWSLEQQEQTQEAVGVLSSLSS